MLRSLWLTIIFLSLIGVSATAPFVATLAYVWVDTFQPQMVAYVILNALPVSMITGAAAFFFYLLLDRRSPPPVNAVTALHIALTIWCACTMAWAEVPAAAWDKFDWAIKTLAFTAFLPYVIRSRTQIEGFVQVFVFSLGANFIPFGLKVLISGGGYGQNLGLQGGNGGLAEGGLLSTICLMSVPLSMFLASNQTLLPRWPGLRLGYWVMAGLAIATAIGTYERSALVGMIVLAAVMWSRSKHKFALGLVIVVLAGVIVYAASSSWSERIDTIGTYQSDDSALGRILVWKWTLQYSLTHPFGGAFNSFYIDHIEFPAEDGVPAHIAFGKAFHSTYFEMLGEQGYPGLMMAGAIVVLCFLRLRSIAKRVRNVPELRWLSDLCDALVSGMAVFLSAGAFVSLGFQPMFWYFVALTVSVHAYSTRVIGALDPLPAWQRSQVPLIDAEPAEPEIAMKGWRGKPVPARPAAPSGRWVRR